MPGVSLARALSLSLFLLSRSLFLSLELFVFREWLCARFILNPKPQTLNTEALRVPLDFSASL
jgi:hypothetical protein